MSSYTATPILPLLVMSYVAVESVSQVAAGITAVARSMYEELERAHREYESRLSGDILEMERRKINAKSAGDAIAMLIERTRPTTVESRFRAFTSVASSTHVPRLSTTKNDRPQSASAEPRSQIVNLLESLPQSSVGELDAFRTQLAKLDAIRAKYPESPTQGYRQLLLNTKSYTKKYLEAAEERRCLAIDAGARLQAIRRQDDLSTFHAEADELVQELAEACDLSGPEDLSSIRAVTTRVRDFFTRVETHLRDELVLAHVENALAELNYSPQRLQGCVRVPHASRPDLGIDVTISEDHLETEIVAFSSRTSTGSREEQLICEMATHLRDRLQPFRDPKRNVVDDDILSGGRRPRVVEATKPSQRPAQDKAVRPRGMTTK